MLVNQAPIADAGPDQVGAPGQELVFSGAGSLDPDGDVVEWLWDFGDGATAGGERVSHRFERPGRYHVRLRVRDDTGQPDAVAYDEAVAAINAPPVAKAGPDLLAAPGAAQESEVFAFVSDVEADQRMEIDRMGAMLATMKEHSG